MIKSDILYVFHVVYEIHYDNGGPRTPRNRITIMRGSTIRNSKATTLSSSLSIDGCRVTNSYTLTLSITQLQRKLSSLTLQLCSSSYITVFSSFIYSYITFWLFTYIVHRGTFWLFTIIDSRIGHEIDSQF